MHVLTCCSTTALVYCHILEIISNNECVISNCNCDCDERDGKIMIIFFLAARSSKSEEKEQNLVVTPSSVENTVRRGTIVRKTFPIGNTRRHARLYSVYCIVHETFPIVLNLIRNLKTLSRD